jgi:hypothetical protein
MIYLGHFSFRVKPSPHLGERVPRHGYCTYVVEAGSIDEALQKFQALLHQLRTLDHLFNNVDKVYLDSCVEIQPVPVPGCLAHYSEHRGEHDEAYYLAQSGQDNKKPFVVFGS